MDMIVENIPNVYNSIKAVKEMPDKCFELTGLLQQIDSRERDMVAQLKKEKACNPCKKPKAYVETYFELVRNFKDNANKTLKCYGEGRRNMWNLIRIAVWPQLDNLLEEGKGLLNKANQLMMEGLTHSEVYSRGMRLPVVELIGNTTKGLQVEGLSSIRKKAKIIGIHGNLGAGKTNFMKLLHNDVHGDPEQYKGVFWAGAPQEQLTNIRNLQDCIAEAIQFKFEDENVTRRSGLLAAKFKNMAPGHVVLFLDNVKEPFRMHEVGIPIGGTETEDDFWCTLVFTASSEDICNKMNCSTKIKMDLLPESEARELFLQEAGWNTHCTRSYSLRMEKIATDVAKQCARMPLVITVMARSMTGKEDICEWNNRLNELKGIVEDIHGDEAKILEQLKFSFNGIKDHTVRSCFLDAAKELPEGRQLPKQSLIQHWVQNGRISRKRTRGAILTSSVINDRGHTIIKELQRVYLLEVVELDGTVYVSMNKWIRKMAEKITPEEEGPYCEL
ncbi:hypothetical protein SOVF_034540 [Spinacia oleracea]|nr:hypothetical protein SOVF_034540 [Spinacia oleracea]